jgi:hypothetical protein
VEIEDIKIDSVTGRAFRGAQEIKLAQQERRCLQLHAQHKGETLPRQLLLILLYDGDLAHDKVLEVTIASLRRKLGTGIPGGISDEQRVNRYISRPLVSCTCLGVPTEERDEIAAKRKRWQNTLEQLHQTVMSRADVIEDMIDGDIDSFEAMEQASISSEVLEASRQAFAERGLPGITRLVIAEML